MPAKHFQYDEEPKNKPEPVRPWLKSSVNLVVGAVLVIGAVAAAVFVTYKPAIWIGAALSNPAHENPPVFLSWFFGTVVLVPSLFIGVAALIGLYQVFSGVGEAAIKAGQEIAPKKFRREKTVNKTTLPRPASVDSNVKFHGRGDG